MPKADKLLQFQVDTGVDVRTIVSGVAEFFTPEEMVGKQVPVLLNLKPRKIRGVVSQGMILFAEDENGKLQLVRLKIDSERVDTSDTEMVEDLVVAAVSFAVLLVRGQRLRQLDSGSGSSGKSFSSTGCDSGDTAL